MLVNRQNAETANNFTHAHKTNKKGESIKCRRNGKTKTWKTRPNEFSIPVKYGLYDYFYITHSNCNEWNVSE